MPTILSGWVDLPAVLTMVEQQPDNPLAGADAEKIDSLKSILKDQKLTWSAVEEDGGITVDLIIPAQIVENAAKLASLAQ